MYNHHNRIITYSKLSITLWGDYMLDWNHVFIHESKYKFQDGLWKQNPAFQNPNSWYENGQRIRAANDAMEQHTKKALDAMDKYINGEWSNEGVIMPERFYNHLDHVHTSPVNLPKLYDDTLITNTIQNTDFKQLELIILLVLFVILVIVICTKLLIKKYQNRE